MKMNLISLVFRVTQEPVEGKIVIKSPTSISHQGVRLSVNGSVNLQVSDSKLSFVSIRGDFNSTEISSSSDLFSGSWRISWSHRVLLRCHQTHSHRVRIVSLFCVFWIFRIPCQLTLL